MNKKLRFMWMLLLTFVCSTIWAEKYDYNKNDGVLKGFLCCYHRRE